MHPGDEVLLKLMCMVTWKDDDVDMKSWLKHSMHGLSAREEPYLNSVFENVFLHVFE
jgi:hypothetical protein